MLLPTRAPASHFSLQPQRYWGTSSAAVGAEESSPANTVAAFYDWYLVHHGRIE